MSTLGFVLPAVSLGLGAVAFRPIRGFYPATGRPVIAQAIVEEIETSELAITEFPVERGASISDHAFRRPAEVIIRCAWSNSPSGAGGFVSNLIGSARGVAATLGGPVVGNILAAGQTIRGAQSILSGNGPGQVKSIWDDLLTLQKAAAPFDVLTGKKKYSNMLFRELRLETTKETENALWIVAVCREVIIALTQTLQLPINTDPAAQADPEKTAPIIDRGAQSLQPSATFTPDAATFGTAVSDLQSSLSTVRAIYGTLPASDLASVTSSAVSALPSALEPAQQALVEIAAKLPAPAEIPLTSGVPQQFTITMNGALSGAQVALSSAVKALPAVLEQAQPAISEAVKQLPAVLDKLPIAFTGLEGVLTDVQYQISDVLKKVPEALNRAPLSTGR